MNSPSPKKNKRLPYTINNSNLNYLQKALNNFKISVFFRKSPNKYIFYDQRLKIIDNNLQILHSLATRIIPKPKTSKNKPFPTPSKTPVKHPNVVSIPGSWEELEHLHRQPLTSQSNLVWHPNVVVVKLLILAHPKVNRWNLVVYIFGMPFSACKHYTSTYSAKGQQKERKSVTNQQVHQKQQSYSILVLFQFTVAGTILTDFLLTLEAYFLEIIRFESFQAHSTCCCSVPLRWLRFISLIVVVFISV